MAAAVGVSISFHSFALYGVDISAQLMMQRPTLHCIFTNVSMIFSKRSYVDSRQVPHARLLMCLARSHISPKKILWFLPVICDSNTAASALYAPFLFCAWDYELQDAEEDMMASLRRRIENGLPPDTEAEKRQNILRQQQQQRASERKSSSRPARWVVYLLVRSSAAS